MSQDVEKDQLSYLINSGMEGEGYFKIDKQSKNVNGNGQSTQTVKPMDSQKTSTPIKSIVECKRRRILHVMVVGFHHKKGCQIDYCHPPMKWPDSPSLPVQLAEEAMESDSSSNANSEQSSNSFTANDGEDYHLSGQDCGQLPRVWKTLPSVALPDGAHNYDRDTIYFHLPHPSQPSRTVYGISCYRQIASNKLKEKSEDVTRASVQKSVVVLSELPLYGLIAVKCEMITYAYFGEYDFSKVSCLKELYANLNGLLSDDLLTTSEVFLGLSPRDLVLVFSHKILILFKLILLEKKVLFYKTPVKELCTTILTLLSLFPGTIEAGGLDQCSASVQQKTDHERKFSSDIELIDFNHDSSDQSINVSVFSDSVCSTVKLMDERRGKTIASMYQNTFDNQTNESSMEDKSKDSQRLTGNDNESMNQYTNKSTNSTESNVSTPDKDSDAREADPLLKHKEEDLMNPNIFSLDDDHFTPLLFKLSLKDCGFPLQLFRKGSYCHPYLSLAYLDILSDPRVRSCVCGATNYLFKQKRQLFDVIIEIDGAKIDIVDVDLKKKLQLSTEDLRFADYLVRCIMENGSRNGNAEPSKTLFDGTSWEGGDEWLRYQFKIYLVQLLKTSQCSESSKEFNSFNPCFMNAWKETQNYKIWSDLRLEALSHVPAGHPFYGQLSISDMKLKLNHAIYNTERGKRLNQTVAQTSKAVGTAITSAKTAVYSWWSQLSSKSPMPDSEKPSSSSSPSLFNSAVTSVVTSTEVIAAENSIKNNESRIVTSLSSFSLSSLLKSSEEIAVSELLGSSKSEIKEPSQ